MMAAAQPGADLRRRTNTRQKALAVFDSLEKVPRNTTILEGQAMSAELARRSSTAALAACNIATIFGGCREQPELFQYIAELKARMAS